MTTSEGESGVGWRQRGPWLLGAVVLLLILARIDARVGSVTAEVASLKEDVAVLHKHTVEVRKKIEATDLKLSNRAASREADSERARAESMDRRAAQKDAQEERERRAEAREARARRASEEQTRREPAQRKARNGDRSKARNSKVGR